MPKADCSARDRNCLMHMLKYCRELRNTLAEIDNSRERFMGSKTYQNATAMCILQLGELTKQLSFDFVQAHPEVPWREMAKTRDQYAHHYGRMDFETVWATASADIPEVMRLLEKILTEQE